VPALISSEILRNGEYEATLLGSTSDGSYKTVAYYYFLVSRR
jgi:hypothetical protein